MSFAEVRTILTDPNYDRQRRLLHLQGQRGTGVEQGVAAGLAIRIGPAQCAISGLLALVAANAGLYALLGVASVVGVVGRRHPVEWVYSWWAVRSGRVPPPPNRAARRFGCFLGAASFFLAAFALVIGSAWLFWPFALILIALPAYVAVTNVCVPSLLFAILLGADRASCPSLPSALRSPAHLPPR
jgi:hypothetical protein